MHLVFLNQYYPPDAAPTGVMLQGVVEGFVKDGHEVTVLCASGGYAADGTSNIVHQTSIIEHPRIIRIGATRFGRGSFAAKVADYASYYLGVIWTLSRMKPRPDRVVALTTPPFLSIVARVLSKIHGGDHAHWVMDLYPDVMVAHGMLREESVIYRSLKSFARWGFSGKRCAAVLTLGPDMAERVERLCRGAAATIEDSRKVQWVPLWGESPSGVNVSPASLTASAGVSPTFSFPPDVETHQDEDVGQDASSTVCSETLQPPADAAPAALRMERGWKEDELIVMYSGNMGLGHRFGEILSAAKALTNESVRFVFFGGGKRLGELTEFLANHPAIRMELHDYAPKEVLSMHLRSADVHLASLDPAWTGTMLPSKLQGIFAAERPVIFIGDRASSIGRWVEESGGGWVAVPGDCNALLAALAEARDPMKRITRGRLAKDFANMHFSKAINVRKVMAVLGSSAPN